MKPSTHRRTRRRRKSPTLPELEQAKSAVLRSLASLQSRRSYGRAMQEFILWYCSEPRLALNRSVVLRYRMRLEALRLAAATINVRLAAVRRLATEAADSGLLSPDLIAGIRRVRRVKQLGRKLGNWLTPEEGQQLLRSIETDTLRGKRDAAMLSILIGCGLRRSELVELDVDQIQQREGHWVILNLVGKGRRVRTVPDARLGQRICRRVDLFGRDHRRKTVSGDPEERCRVGPWTDTERGLVRGEAVRQESPHPEGLTP